MKTTSILVLSCLLYSTIAVTGSIKSKLSQISSQAEVDQMSVGNCTLGALAPPNLGFFSCNASEGLPAPQGSAEFNTFNQQANVAQGQVITQVPNTASLTTCNGECCSAAASNEVSASSSTKSRHFEISGAIDIEESVCFAE
jgi:hypothetical protein